MNNFRSLPELTIRGLLLSALLTVLFTAANVYLGLKIGYTFATSVPAAVISMAALRLFNNSNILENNIVQTITSAAGTLSAIVFVLPALVIIGAWHHFSFWQTFLLTSLGGTLGVMFTIPLRKALVVNSDLPYPEGTAAAEVLKVGSLNQPTDPTIPVTNEPIKNLALGSAVSFLFTLFSNGLKLFGQQLAFYGKIGVVVSGWGISLGPALVGAGYLIGIQIAIALLIGAIISWGVAVPILSLHHTAASTMTMSDYALKIWITKVRFIGIGTISIAVLWALLALLRPLAQSFNASKSAIHMRSFNDSDIPARTVIITSILLLFPLMTLFGHFISHYTELSDASFLVVAILCTLMLVVIGFAAAGVSAYMAGLVGSSNSPVSGIGVIIIIIVAAILTLTFHLIFKQRITFLHHRHFIVALAIFVTAAIFAVVTIANDNMQDLRTGYLVGATPWKQQVALIMGVILGSLVIAPVLNALYQAYGFADLVPHIGIDTHNTLNTPQAALMATIAKGIVGDYMNWDMVFIGMAIGIVMLLIDRFVLKPLQWPRLSVLSVGIGIYIPIALVSALVLGGIISWFIKRKIYQFDNKKRFFAERCGILFACGLIVGESIFGILLAVIITLTEKASPLALVSSHFIKWANLIGALVFILLCIHFYYYVTKRNRSG
ncbi:MAG: oligopeptide transporter, OPT family [Gammaproteobacteria bacterium]|nr:oligopeptide transporter, OPT family [Gammaproteobacteria bacterium]